MAKRDIRRNGRGQIISYEIFGATDSAIESDQYGDVELTTPPQNYSTSKKYVEYSYNDGRLSYGDLVDTEFSNELIPSFTQPALNVIMGEIIGNDKQGGGTYTFDDDDELETTPNQQTGPNGNQQTGPNGNQQTGPNGPS